MSFLKDTMYNYLIEINTCVKNGNKKKVVSLINEMKNFYMVENDLKPGKKSKEDLVLENHNPDPPKNEKRQSPSPSPSKKEYVVEQEQNKPRKNIFY